MAKIVGIDFGAQMSGNTVIAHIVDEKIEFNQVVKKQNTDSWLKATIKEIKPETVYIDAPLSLPKAYYGRV